MTHFPLHVELYFEPLAGLNKKARDWLAAVVFNNHPCHSPYKILYRKNSWPVKILIFYAGRIVFLKCEREEPI